MFQHHFLSWRGRFCDLIVFSITKGIKDEVFQFGFNYLQSSFGLKLHLFKYTRKASIAYECEWGLHKGNQSWPCGMCSWYASCERCVNVLENMNSLGVDTKETMCTYFLAVISIRKFVVCLKYVQFVTSLTLICEKIYILSWTCAHLIFLPFTDPFFELQQVGYVFHVNVS